jgi:hypothetical protein
MRNLLAVGLLFIVFGSYGQSTKKLSRQEYFDKYHQMAVDEMHRSGVPASITLAQGALESGDGNSTLARKANNHFGIKCHKDWNGKTTYQDDDSRNECFRKYASVEDSYRDHTDYLKSGSRYAFLFELDITDYKGWARGLKKAGYATSPSYADRLIDIIEEFGLTKYDESIQVAPSEKPEARATHKKTISREIFEINRVKCIKARAGDTYASLTAEMGKLDWELPKYNDGTIADSLVPGQLIYIQPKRNKARMGEREHVFKTGETMLEISQLYAVKLESLYRLNQMEPGTQPDPGAKLELRRASKSHEKAKPESTFRISGGKEEDDIKVDLGL